MLFSVQLNHRVKEHRECVCVEKKYRDVNKRSPARKQKCLHRMFGHLIHQTLNLFTSIVNRMRNMPNKYANEFIVIHLIEW